MMVSFLILSLCTARDTILCQHFAPVCLGLQGIYQNPGSTHFVLCGSNLRPPFSTQILQTLSTTFNICEWLTLLSSLPYYNFLLLTTPIHKFSLPKWVSWPCVIESPLKVPGVDSSYHILQTNVSVRRGIIEKKYMSPRSFFLPSREATSLTTI
jgi:hypothetical protein